MKTAVKASRISIAVALVLLGTVSAPPAHAALVEFEAEPGQVCTVGVQGTPIGEALPVSPETVVSCFDDRAAAEDFIRSGARGDIEVLSGTLPRGAAATVILGYVWTGQSRGGTELIHWGTGGTCDGLTYGFPSLSAAWDNAVQSAEAKGSCWVTLYDSTNYGGSRVNCTPFCSTLGSLNSKASSIVYRPVGTFG